MKQIYTALFLFFFVASNAQSSHELVVDAPSSAAGRYAVQIASFGQYACSVSGDASAVVDAQGVSLGCGSISTDLTGKIALIDRGTCNFSEKVLNAQKKGAIAVVVVNNAAGAQLISMGPTQPAAAQVTIPSFFISQPDGAKLKAALAGGLKLNILTPAFTAVDTVKRDVVWGNVTGQGDFAGGRNGWTVRNIWCGNGQSTPKVDLWTWNGSAATPVSSCGRGVLASPTSCNGAMVFASNYLDDNGAECGAALGSGDCPAGQLGELISPVIRLRGAGTSGYQLSFYQNTRQLNSDYAVLWSVNGGITWDTTLINEDISSNASNTNPFVLLPLANTANADSLIVKFNYSGNYYHWIIDDVKILAQEQNNLRVNDFYAIPPSFATPLSQVEPIGFLADIENTGSLSQTDVSLGVTVQNAAKQVVFTGQRAVGTVNGNTLLENQVLNSRYTPTAKGVYTAQYEVSAAQTDFDKSDNIRSFSFSVTDSTFAKEDGTNLRVISPSASNWDASEPHSAAYGNVFFVPRGKGFFSRKVQFGLANAAELKDRALILTLYKWVDANADGLAQATERTSVAFNFYEVKGTESSPLSLISLPLPAESEPPVELEDNTMYLIMLEYYAPQVDGVDLDALVSDKYDYKAQVFLGLASNTPRFTSMTGLAGDLTQETFGPNGFSSYPGDYSYVIRWDISGDRATPVRTEPVLNDQFAVFPNPAADVLNVQLALRQESDVLQADLVDHAGRVVKRYSWENIQRDILTIPTDQLTPGVYFLRIQTSYGVGSKKVVIAR